MLFTSVRAVTRSIFFASAAAVALLPASPAQAGPFLDWLLGRPITVYPAPVAAGYAAPTVAGYAPTPVAAAPGVIPAQTTYYAPTVAAAPAYVGNQPTTMAAPVVANYPTAVPATTAAIYQAPAVAQSPLVAQSPVVVQSPVVTAAPAAVPVAVQPVQPVMSGYATYRTTWNRIPVTYYRPVTSYQAGYAVTAMQPCNTYTWQARRVPARWNFRPWVPFSSAAPVTYGYAPVVAPTTAVAPAVTYAPAAVPCTNCPTQTAVPAGVAYPTAPATVVAPQGSVPANFPPSLQQPYNAGATTIPDTMGATQVPAAGYSTMPADQAPVLSPGNYSSPAPSVDPPNLQPVPSFGNPPAMTVPSTTVPSTTVAPMTVPTNSAASSQKPAFSPYRVTPIPAPDVRSYPSSDSGRATSPSSSAPQAPPLLKQRERSASSINGVSQPVSIGQASYVTPKPLTTQKTPMAPTTTAKPLWDDSGWRTAR